MKKLIVFLLLTAFALGLMPTAAAVETPFTDVPSDGWYAEAVAYVYSEKLMVGVEENHFAPEGTVTRAMVVTPLWRREGSEVVDKNYAQPFSDVSGAWYTEPVTWAISKEIVKGYPLPFTGMPTGVFYYFAPDQNVTREELAAFLYRYAAAIGMDTSARADLSGFADQVKVSDWAKEAIKWCVAVKIIDGMTEGGTQVLQPQGTATRAQFAAMLMRFDNLPLVIDACNGSWKTSTGDERTYAIPKIELPGAEIEALNEEICKSFYKDYLNEDDLYRGPIIGYEWYVNGDILTLILHGVYELDFMNYSIYSVRISTAHVMTPEEVLTEAGMTAAEFETKASDALGNAYCVWLADYISKYIDSDEQIVLQFQKTISNDNAARAVPFFDEKGVLSICGNIYQIAGADYHEELLPLTDYKTSEYYDVLLSKLG